MLLEEQAIINDEANRQTEEASPKKSNIDDLASKGALDLRNMPTAAVKAHIKDIFQGSMDIQSSS